MPMTDEEIDALVSSVGEQEEPATSGSEQSDLYGYLTQEEIMELVQRHGGVKGLVPQNNAFGLPDKSHNKLVFGDGTYITIKERADGGWSVTNPGTALRQSSSNEASQWTIQTGPDGRKYRVNEVTGEFKEAFPGVPDKAPAAPRLAPRYAEDVEYSQLRNEEMRQKLENPYTQRMKYMQQAWDKINEIQQGMMRGEIDARDADRQIKGFQEWIQADMMGATPFQMQKDTRDFNYQKEQDRRGLAFDVLRNRSATGSSIAQGLMESLLGAYGKMYSGANPNYNIDYFGMTKALTDEYTGGQDLNELGMAILKGAFSPKGGW